MKEESHVKTKPSRPWTEDVPGNNGSGPDNADFRAGNKIPNGAEEEWPEPQAIEDYLLPVLPISRNMLPTSDGGMAM
jgi:hypothetical protein